MQDYISQHDDSNPFVARRRAQVLAEARRNSAPYLARIDRETVATLSTDAPRKRTRRHLKVIK